MMKRDDDYENWHSITEAELAGAAYVKGTEGHNHPDYWSDLEESKRNQDELSSCTSLVFLRKVGKEFETVLRTTAPRNLSKARDYTIRVGEHFEAPVQFQTPNEAGDSPNLLQKDFNGKAPNKFFKGSL